MIYEIDRFKKIGILFLAFILLLIAAGSVYCREVDSERDKQDYNIIIISMDTLRHDHLSFAGYERKTSPNIDKLLAEEGIVFTQAISQASWTLPSNASILTSQYVPAHNLDRASKMLSQEKLTLAEILKIYGYSTAAFTGGFHLSHIYGLNQGFDFYYDKKEHASLKDIIPLASDWIKENKESKFLLFLQAYDCHAPFATPRASEHIYDPDYEGIMDDFIFNHSLGDLIRGHTLTDPVTGEVHKLEDRDIDHIIAHYDAAISHMDKQIGKLFKELKRLGLLKNTIIVFLGDHGEELMERDGRILKRKHGDAYEEGIRVPLIIRHPGLKKLSGKIIKKQVQLIDVAPTILDFINKPVSHTMQGASLVPLIYDTATDDFNEYVFSGGYNQRQEAYFSEYMAIRTEEWKLMHVFDYDKQKIRFELYNIKDDPKETEDLSFQYPDRVEFLKNKLFQWFEESRSLAGDDEVDYGLYDDMKEKMRDFGYWWVGGELDPEAITKESGLK